MNSKLLSLSSIALGLACSTTNNITQVSCGPGTMLVNGVCQVTEDASSSGSSSGSVTTDAAPPIEACTPTELTLAKPPLYMVIVADGSGSTAGTAWGLESSELRDYTDRVSRATQASLSAGKLARTALGLIVFSDSMDTSGGVGPYPTANDVGIGPILENGGRLASMWGRLSGTPSGGTPTKAALAGAYSMLETYVPTSDVQPNGKRLVVLVTDGVPTDDTPAGSTWALAKAKAAQSSSVYTAAIGIATSTSTDPAFLGNLTRLAGTASTTCDPATNLGCFASVMPSGQPGQLVKALVDLESIVASCYFDAALLGGGNAITSDTKVSLVDDAGATSAIGHDKVNGWWLDEVTEPKRLVLNGVSCVQARGATGGGIKVALGCK